MSLADTIALGAADRLASAAGARAGYAAYRTLAANATTEDVRAKAILGALSCACDARDVENARAMTKSWMSVSIGIWAGKIIALCKRFDAVGFYDVCLELARIESESRPEARVAYVLARGLLRKHDDEGACRALAIAMERADREGASRLAAASRLLRARILAGHAGGLSRTAARTREAIDEATLIDAKELAPASRVDLAELLLLSPSRFTRASALSVLERTAATESGAEKKSAVRLAAQHADRAGGAITPLELDRVLATLAHWPDEASRNTAISRVKSITLAAHADSDVARHAAVKEASELSPDTAQHLARAIALLAGGRGGASPSGADVETEMKLAHVSLDVVAAVRDARDGDAMRAIAEAMRVVRGGGRPSAALWTAITIAANGGAMVRADAVTLARHALDAGPAAPSRGWLWLAQAMEDARAPDLTVRALYLAVSAGERGAREALGARLRARAWSIATAALLPSEMARIDAAALLAEAKTLLSRS